MNIGSLYNTASLFQNMYNAGNYGSSSMASLTSSVLGGASSASGMYSSLSDYSLIKSGSYGKLVSAYYDVADSEEKKTSKSSTDILEKLKASKTPADEKDKNVVVETADGKVTEKTESAATDSKSDTATAPNKKVDVLADLMRRKRTISYTNMGNVVKNMSTPSFDYIV